MARHERPGMGITSDRADDAWRVLLEATARAEAEATAGRLRRLQALSAALVEAATTEQVAGVLVDEGFDSLGAAAGALLTVDHASERLHVLRTRGFSPAMVARFGELTFDAPLPAAAVARTGAPIYIAGVEALAARYPGQPPPENVRAWAAVPLRVGDRVLAVLTLSFVEERAVSEHEQALIESLARLGALALERAQLFASEQQARRQAERAVERLVRLQGLTAAMADARAPDEAARFATEHAMSATGAEAGLAFLIGGSGALHLSHARGLPDEEAARLATVDLDAPLGFALAVRKGEASFQESSREGNGASPWLAARQAQGLGGAVATLPLTSGGQSQGVLVLAFAHDRAFDQEERSLLVAVARQVGQALERARLRAAEAEARRAAERGEQRAAFLARASAVLTSSLDYSTTLSRVAELTVPGFADWCAIDLLDAGGRPRRLSVEHGDPKREWAARELCRDYPLDPRWPEGIARTLRTGEAQFIPDLGDPLIDRIARDPRHAMLLRTLGYASGISVAVTARGRVLGALTFVREPSSARYDRADLELAQSLANRVSIAMDNAQLYAEARDAVRVRDEFLSVASHELRTPLTTLLLQLQGVRRKSVLDERTAGRIESAERQAERLEALIGELLDVSRITAGRLTLQREPVELTALVRDLADRFEGVAAGKGSHVVVEAGPPVTGSWDPLRIDQILTNLLHNALKYGESSPVVVRVEAAGDRARVSVTDQGTGIAPEDQERIFQRFERAASERHFGGLGLGLWISRELARAHGGELSVESVPGRGSTFRLELPLS